MNASQIKPAETNRRQERQDNSSDAGARAAALGGRTFDASGTSGQPRRLTVQQRDALSDLALMVSTLLESRQMSSEATHIGQILNYAFDEIIMLDARTLKIQFVNGGAQQALGRSQSELLGMSLHKVVGGYPMQMLQASIHSPDGDPADDDRAPLCFEAHHIRKNCDSYPVEVRAVVIGSAGREQLILLANDISERRRSERVLEDMAVNDIVTRLPNRYRFETRLQAATQAAGTHGGPVALMLIEIDRLRGIRLAYGQRVADDVLSEFGERLRRCVGASDLVAHLGGDEFAVILEDYYDADTPRQTAVVINDVLEAPFQAAQESLRITARIGIALFEDGQDSADALLGRADEALNEATQMGVKLRVFPAGGLRAGSMALV